jgi:predicted nuclease of predicted toxin-antitoxin system
MKFLFDQNISIKILRLLPDYLADSSHVKKEGLINADDKAIWAFAKKNNFVIVTQDSDFNELNLLYGFPPKIIWIRMGNIKTQNLYYILTNHFSEIESFIDNAEYGCFEIGVFRKN